MGLIILMDEDSDMTKDNSKSFIEVFSWNILTFIKVKDTGNPSAQAKIQKNCTFD
ncbi:hypothetical protein C943_00542 [Mariniradius saccharolyticus AK6]|uniref:Uncharacterized protein n=1 Tax=Mariniradius saccharolyticus AK6 TaxID=1239962 RepID=M7XEF1_9BACT|nr:hypothetical protein C943_00542 [Mariniradius saccharolyticus AK6]